MKEETENEHEYDDIINLPHHVSARRPHMDVHDRAAQFSAFAALTGHDEAIKETARLTDTRMELDENTKEILDLRLQILMEHLSAKPKVFLIYFRSDDKKSGGQYVNITGRIKKIDDFRQCMILEDGTTIPINDIYELEGKIFQ